MNIPRWPIVMAGCGLCLNLIVPIYLMLASPEGSSFGIAEQLLDAKAVGPPDSDARIDYIVRDLQFRAQVDIHLNQVIFLTLLLDSILFGTLVWATIKAKRTVAANVR